MTLEKKKWWMSVALLCATIYPMPMNADNPLISGYTNINPYKQ